MPLSDRIGERGTISSRSAIRASRRGRPAFALWLAIVCGAAAGACLWLAYPPAGLWPLTFLGIGLSILCLVGRSAGGAFIVGLATGAALYFPLVSWSARYLGPLPWIALAGLESVLWATGSILITWAWRFSMRALRSARPMVAVLVTAATLATVWMLREQVLGSWPYSGFPWARVGMAFADSPIARVASWTSVSGLGVVTVFGVAAAVVGARSLDARDGARIRPSALVRFAPAVLIALVLITVPPYPTTPTGTLRVGAVQGNGPAGYFDERAPNAVLRAQTDASAPLIGRGVQLVIWPEGSVDSDPTHRAATARVLDALSRDLGAPVLVNAATQRGDQYFNTSLLWQADSAGPMQSHDKREPVPFGEYVPDRWFYRAFAPDLIDLIQREYTPGTNAPVMQVGDTRVGLAICFDVIYDDVIWEGDRDGAQFYAFQTNNADFRGTDESAQQLAFARMRAVETGRSVVNLSTVGQSQVIAADGRTLQALPVGRPGALVADVQLRTGTTPATVIGPGVRLGLFVLGPALLLALGAVARLGESRARERDDAPAS